MFFSLLFFFFFFFPLSFLFCFFFPPFSHMVAPQPKGLRPPPRPQLPTVRTMPRDGAGVAAVIRYPCRQAILPLGGRAGGMSKRGDEG
jgi:hypothetical protein